MTIHTPNRHSNISKRRFVLLTFHQRRKILLRDVSEIKFYIILGTATAAVGLYKYVFRIIYVKP